MAANVQPVFSLTSNVSGCQIPTAAALTRSDGVTTIGTNSFIAFQAGNNGSFVQKIRYFCAGSTANTTSVATTLRAFISNLNAGATTGTNTFLINETSVPAIAADNSTNATNYYDVPLNFAIQSGQNILVSQHVAQTTAQTWGAVVIGGNY